MINQNLQMNKFKDLLKGMNRRISRLERYASGQSMITENLVLDVEGGTHTWGNSTGFFTYTRANRWFTMTFEVNFGTTYAAGLPGSYFIQMPFPLSSPSGGSGLQYYGNVLGWKSTGVGAAAQVGVIMKDDITWDIVKFKTVNVGLTEWSATYPWTWDGNGWMWGQLSGMIAEGY